MQHNNKYVIDIYIRIYQVILVIESYSLWQNERRTHHYTQLMSEKPIYVQDT